MEPSIEYDVPTAAIITSPKEENPLAILDEDDDDDGDVIIHCNNDQDKSDYKLH